MTSLASSASSANIEALHRATRDRPKSNDGPTISAFNSRGIGNVETFGPLQNVFTYRAWQAKGRQVRKGEKSVKIGVWVQGTKTDKETGKEKTVSFPRTACVFHITQTDTIRVQLTAPASAADPIGGAS